jgi:hypothetical protein
MNQRFRQKMNNLALNEQVLVMSSMLNKIGFKVYFVTKGTNTLLFSRTACCYIRQLRSTPTIRRP